jgi:hypothetical protein
VQIGRRLAADLHMIAKGRRGYVTSGTISIAPHGHSSTQMPQPLQ